MRTKEAILNEVAKKKDTDLLASAHTYVEDYAGGSVGYYRDDIVETAMNEYAKEVALGVLKWFNKTNVSMELTWAQYQIHKQQQETSSLK